MLLLALDTSMQACSASLLSSDGAATEPCIVSRYEEIERGHAERLLPMIDEILSEAAVDIRKIDRFAVTRGPGTFTGVRIGIATARGLALACRRPLVGLNSLEVMAARVRREHRTSAQPIAIAVDARRGELYWQLFDAEAKPLSPPEAVRPEAAAAKLAAMNGPVLIAGSGTALLGTASEMTETSFLRLLPDAATLAQLAANQQIDETYVTGSIGPLYLRAPDAKVQEGFAVERS